MYYITLYHRLNHTMCNSAYKITKKIPYIKIYGRNFCFFLIIVLFRVLFLSRTDFLSRSSVGNHLFDFINRFVSRISFCRSSIRSFSCSNSAPDWRIFSSPISSTGRWSFNHSVYPPTWWSFSLSNSLTACKSSPAPISLQIISHSSVGCQSVICFHRQKVIRLSYLSPLRQWCNQKLLLYWILDIGDLFFIFCGLDTRS